MSDVSLGRIKIKLFANELPKYVYFIIYGEKLILTTVQELVKISDNFAPGNTERMVAQEATKGASFIE